MSPAGVPLAPSASQRGSSSGTLTVTMLFMRCQAADKGGSDVCAAARLPSAGPSAKGKPPVDVSARHEYHVKVRNVFDAGQAF